MSEQIFEKWQSEQAYIELQRKTNPDLFIRKDSLSLKQQLSRIGIVLPWQEITTGVIKYFPFDFIVEEVLKSNEVVTVDFDIPKTPSGSGPFLTFDLVKIGISTMDVIQELAAKLQIKETQIGYGGIKDAIALTAQRFSVSGIKPELLVNLPATNYFIKNINYSDEAISMNSIRGNRFTILIRTPGKIDKNLLAQRINELNTNGFYNFYWLQRFGNRLLSHWWGSLILQGKEEKAIHSFLCEPGPNESEFFSKLRTKANKEFENWNKIIEIYKPLQFTFRNELTVLNYLKEFRRDYVGALRAVSEQAKMWLYAYSSFLFNKILSFGAAGEIEVSSKLPLLLSNNPNDVEIYRKFLEMDRIPKDFAQKIRRLDFIRLVSRNVETKLFAENISYKILPQCGIVVSFDLPKGAYATTFLSHIFSLDGAVLPQIKNTIYDPKEVLGSGSINETKKILEKYIVIRKTEEQEV